MNSLTKAFAGCLLAASAVAGAQDIRATVNGNPVYFNDVQPTMVNGRVMVPLRGVFEHMGATVLWLPETQTVVTKASGGTEIRLPINSMTAYVDGRATSLDSPAILFRGRTMVPLRFTAEALDANVQWLSDSRTVAIDTMVVENPPTNAAIPIAPRGEVVRIEANTVIPFRLDRRLNSKDNRVGDRFTATLDPANGMNDYLGLPSGTQIEGRVDTVKAREGNTPGVLGLEFTRIKLPDGRTHAVDGALIGLDNKSVEESNGRITAKSGAARNDSLKYVGYGAGAGLLLSVLGKGDALTNALIGGALGYLFGEIQKGNQQPGDVNLNEGTRFGVRLERDLQVRILPAR